MKPEHRRNLSGLSAMSLPKVDENAESFELLNKLPHRDHTNSGDRTIHDPALGRRASDKAWILLLSLTAVVPAVLGLLFLFSLRLSAPHGVTSERTFTRPLDEGLEVYIGKWHITLSPLLVSSIASSIIGDLGILAMSLVAFPVAYLWLQASRRDSSSIPPPYQFFLVSEMIAHSSPFALMRFVAYAFRPSRRTSPSRHEPIVSMLWVTAAAALILLMLSSTIKVLDIVLHDQLASTLLYRNVSTVALGSAFVSPLCDASNITSCAVLPRAQEADLGGQNKSSTFGVYVPPYDPASNMSISFAGSTNSDNSLSLTATTIAIATSCYIVLPKCTKLATTAQPSAKCYNGTDDPYYDSARGHFSPESAAPLIMIQDSTGGGRNHTRGGGGHRQSPLA